MKMGQGDDDGKGEGPHGRGHEDGKGKDDGKDKDKPKDDSKAPTGDGSIIVTPKPA
ncbi:MAG: hypothetical protein H7318_05715 [Oligoflexus sp.]|nr:hypothetical protein [Oligoflexus sp.]